ncbi:MAG TPA: hypothetical protein DEF88_11035 [Porphyromonadaceae bacterium]|jgi:hypothetical protein|nr:hypothetical protein [Porphyromonadaceae bacterium]HBK31447.1 hypothetical protein [Porphyromonadaceae bacterium]HBX20970.1 hypothetical protein [Porphyromonadaceae bacterium]
MRKWILSTAVIFALSLSANAVAQDNQKAQAKSTTECCQKDKNKSGDKKSCCSKDKKSDKKCCSDKKAPAAKDKTAKK